MSKKRLGLVTPAKNEVQNISELVDGVLSNSENILAWVFVNDQSDDGTLELIESKYSEIIKHIDYFTIINMVGTDELYGLGKKYSSVVSFGFDRLKILESKHSFRCDYVGILDADSIPSADYYSNILDDFKCSSKIGIYSGINVIRNENGRERILLQNSSWAAGNCRVWRRECFDEAGYVVEVSADAVSAARAVMRSWQVGSTDTAKVYTREMKGGGEGWKYYGKSMYVRNIPTYYMFAFVLRQFVNFRHKEAIGLFLGYMDAKKRSVPKISDELAKKYFKNILYYRIKNIFNK